jgi:nucleotide-binding universal stress UspA family protein
VDPVLIGFDETDSAARALARAADVAAAFRARLVVVSVAQPVPAPAAEPLLQPVGPIVAAPAGLAPVPTAQPLAPPARLPEPEELARRDLERARSYLSQRRVEVDYVAEIGDPAERLLEAADRYDAELIVVGSREHGFLERLLGRPVDERIARRAHRDVLLVH